MNAFVNDVGRLAVVAAGRSFALFSVFFEAIVEAREIRARLEAERFRGRHRISWKSNDDLPTLRGRNP